MWMPSSGDRGSLRWRLYQWCVIHDKAHRKLSVPSRKKWEHGKAFLVFLMFPLFFFLENSVPSSADSLLLHSTHCRLGMPSIHSLLPPELEMETPHSLPCQLPSWMGPWCLYSPKQALAPAALHSFSERSAFPPCTTLGTGTSHSLGKTQTWLKTDTWNEIRVSEIEWIFVPTYFLLGQNSIDLMEVNIFCY